MSRGGKKNLARRRICKMAQPFPWYLGNDQLVSVSGVRTSTMASTAYLNSSTNLTVNLWKTQTTAASTNRFVTNRVLSYIAASNGNYRATIQSTEASSIVEGTKGLAIFTLSQAGLNAEWRAPFLGQYRRTT